jgi:hypothetical protein
VPKRQCLTVLTFDRIYVKVRMEKSWERALVLIPPKIAVHTNLAKAFRHRVAAASAAAASAEMTSPVRV